MKLGCMNVKEDFKRNIRMKLGSLTGLILGQNCIHLSEDALQDFYKKFVLSKAI